MTRHSPHVRSTTITWVAGVAILMATLSCDTFGPEPKPLPLPAVPEVPATPAAPAPIVAITRGQMVFVDQSSSFFSIFLADSSGAKLQLLSVSGSDDFDPAVSADGKKIAFSSHVRSEDGRDIWVMNADGTNRVRLTHTVSASRWISSASPAWSPDGERIAFVTSTGLWEHQIFVMNADGSDVKQVTAGDDTYSLAPEWSPDGSRILFSHISLHSEDTGISEMNPDGSNVRQLTSGYATEPTRSPDGTRIAFLSGESLFVMNADGSNPTALATVLDWETDITWSPDGKSIVFGVNSASRMCGDWTGGDDYACGHDLKRVGLDGVIDPTWGLLSASNLVWQR